MHQVKEEEGDSKREQSSTNAGYMETHAAQLPGTSLTMEDAKCDAVVQHEVRNNRYFCG